MNVSYLSSSVTEERLECAFQLAETPEVHRAINISDMVTISKVYSSKRTVCNMWDRFQNMVGFLNLNYSKWNNIVC